MSSFVNTLSDIPSQIFNYISTLVSQILETLNLTNKSGTLLLLGLDNAGKTTLLHRLRTNTVVNFPPTDRPNTESFSMGRIQFIGMDLGGHEAVRHLWEDYCIGEGVSAIVFLLDVVDYGRLEEVRDELDNLVSILLDSKMDDLNYDGDIDPEDGSSGGSLRGVVPLAILLNKCDLNNALESREIARAIGYEEIAERYGDANVGMFRISVWRGEGYQEAFRWISEFL